MDFDVSVIVKAIPALLQGAKLTVLITVVGLLGGTVVGLVFGLMRAYGNRLLDTLGFLYIELVRGTPIVVQVMFIYFALPVIADIRVDPLTAAIVSIVVNSGAYIAEIVRGAFLSVPKGLREAGLALGMPLAFTLVLTSLTYLLGIGGVSLIILPIKILGGVDSFVLLSIPLFILAGALMESGGISERIVDFAMAIVGRVRGGLAMVAVVAEILFSGISGSTTADVSAISSLLAGWPAKPVAYENCSDSAWSTSSRSARRSLTAASPNRRPVWR